MSETPTKRIGRDVTVGIALLLVCAIAMVLVLNSYSNEGAKRSAVISDDGDKDPDHIETFVKLMSVDPVKGDIVAS